MKTRLLLLCLGLFASLHGQVLIRVQQGNSIAPIANGGSVTVNSTLILQPRTLQIIITYTGATRLTFPATPQLLGSQDFTITRPPVPNTNLGPNQSLTIELQYLPSTGHQVQSELDYGYLQAASASTDPTQTPQAPTPGIIAIGLTGTTPDYSLNYGLSGDGNFASLPPGGTLSFVDTAVNSATLVSMVLLNRGSGSGQIESVTATGDAFSLVAMPLLPALLQSGATFQFQLRYRPRQVGTDTGRLSVTFEGGATYSVALKGTSLTSFLSYELLLPDGSTQVFLPNQAVVLPLTPVGEKTTAFVRMRNSSTLDLLVDGIAVSGAAFLLSDTPFLPRTMAPGETQLFSIIFSPSQAGKQSGRLRIGSDSFDLSGEGVGSLLTFSYRSPAGITNVQPLGGVIFPAVSVGESSTIQFTIRNSGSAPAPIISVGIVSGGTGKPTFVITGLPALPAAIQPNTSLSFSVKFSPLNTDLSSASLRINTEAFTLAGIGSRPELLPDFTIQGPTTALPFQQPGVSLTLASPYNLALTGTLTLSTSSEIATSDPAVQFVTGGRVAAFTIPAGSTNAVFSGGSNQIKFQTGSVAATIVLTPAFATQGGLDLTGASPRQLQIGLPAAAPQLAGLSVDARTPNGFTLSLVGYSTTRSLSKMTVSFKGRPGYNFSQTDFALDLAANSFIWFNSQASAAFGGQFLLQVPFSLGNSDTATTALPPIQTIESVTLTVTNPTGTSNTMTALIQ